MTTYVDQDTALLGWHDKVDFAVTAGDYDDVLQELYIKYSSSFAAFGPEITLIFMLVTSATIHCVNSNSKKSNTKASLFNNYSSPENQDNYSEAEEPQEFTGLSSDTQEMFDNFINQQGEKKAKKKSRK